YVNMHKVFEAYPDTEKARVELNQFIAQKKDDITGKKEEIAKLKAEIEFLQKQMTAVKPSATPKPASSEPLAPPAAPESTTALTLPEGSPLKFLFSPPESTGT